MRAFRPLVLRWRVCSAGCCCGGFAAGALWGWLCHWVLAGCMAVVLRGCAYPAGCCCGGFAAGALLGWLCHWVLAGCMACVLRWCVFPAGCCCHALPLVRFWSVLRLSLWGVLHTREKHYPWVYRGCVNYRCTPFPLINNRPLSEGAAGASRLGEGRYIEKPSGPADAQPVLRECSLWQLWLPG